MRECPRCDEPLRPGARWCACGWQARAKKETAEPARERARCAHETCHIPALCKVKTATGWANFCEQHYVMHHDGLARSRCAEKDLLKRADESSADYSRRMLAYLRKNAKAKSFADAERAEDAWAKDEAA